MDFCIECEREHGTITLYRRYVADATARVRDAVYAAHRTPVPKRTQEQVRLLVEPPPKLTLKTKEEIATAELQRRELARRRLLYFVMMFFPDYKAGWVHQDIARRLEQFMFAVERGESPRLMLFVPPRHGKSRLLSDMFISWLLGHHPEWEVISASYAQSLPIGFSRNIRDRMQDPEYQAIFPNSVLRRDSLAVDDWRTTSGGGYMAAGIGVGITGRGAHVGLIDDPVKDEEAAQSETIRENTYAWYQSTFRSRLAPGGGILVVQTRWHDADLSGKLLEDEEKLRALGIPANELENWEVVSYPAIAERNEYLMNDGTIAKGDVDHTQVKRTLRHVGEALHPERYSLTELKRIKNSMAPLRWASLFQQNPVPDDGAFFKRTDFIYRQLDPDVYPQGIILVTADYAFGKKNRNDYTVISVGILMPSAEVYVLHVRRGRWTSLETADHLVDVIEKFKPQVFAGEQGATHAAVWPIVHMQLEKKRLFVSIDTTLTPIQDKELRARPIQAYSQMHKLIFSFDEKTKPAIFDAIEREMLRFPTGSHDDIVDSLSWLVRLAMVTSVPSEPEKPKIESWKDRLRELASSGDGEHSFMGQ